MEFKTFFEDEDAVSPVIGVILMVAITVILAAVIGTFVLGLGDQVQTTSPNAQWDAEQTTTSVTTAGSNSTIVEFSHDGGQEIDADTLSVSHDLPDNLAETNVSISDQELSAGSTVELQIDPGSSKTITISEQDVDLLWNSEGQSQTLSTITIDEIEANT